MKAGRYRLEYCKDGRWHRTQINLLARDLGVSASACFWLGAVWATPQYRGWAWPMRDGYYEYVGIRLRSPEGRKWAVKGSHQGLFLPTIDPQETCYVCEGPTDTAAALSMGLFAIGRPSCLGCEVEVARLFRRLDVRRAVIVADADDPGFNGARKLAASLPIPSVVIVPPTKDLRAFYQMGGTRAMIEALASQQVWNVP